MKRNSWALALCVLLFPLHAIAYTGSSAEDAFFWHYWHKVFLEPSPIPPGDTAEVDEDFGVFFANTNKWESIWLMGGLENFVWGADWFSDKQMDPHYVPFSQGYNMSTSARFIFAYSSKESFGLPWDFQLGSYLRWANGASFHGIDMLQDSTLLEYVDENQRKVSLGVFLQSRIDAKRFVANLQWIPGIGDFLQPAMGKIDLGVRAYKFLIGPSAVWQTSSMNSALQSGLSLRRSTYGGSYTVKLQNNYRQNSKKLDYKLWQESLSDPNLWTGTMEIETPMVCHYESEGAGIKLNGGAWLGQEDGNGWRLGMSNYFSKTLHMDLSIAHNDWSQDPAVGKTGGYKFQLSYYN